MERISKHISYTEATKSNTAIREGIDNTPNLVFVKNMRLVAEKVFEPLREWYGKPIWITSFYRSPELNRVIRGSKTSDHMLGHAIDIDTESDNAKLFHWILNNLDFDQLIWEFGDDYQPAWIHVSYKEEGNRCQVLKAFKEGGQTKYSFM